MALILPGGQEVPIMPSTEEEYNEQVRRIDEYSTIMAGGKGLLAATYGQAKRNEVELHSLKLHLMRKGLIDPAAENRQCTQLMGEMADEMQVQAEEITRLRALKKAAADTAKAP